MCRRCVLFYSPTVAATKLLALWNNLAEKEDKQEIYAAVSLPTFIGNAAMIAC